MKHADLLSRGHLDRRAMTGQIEQYLRSDEPLTLSRFDDQAHDFASRFTYQEGSHPGLSVVLATNEADTDAQLASRRLSTRPWVGVARVGARRQRGFVLLPTFDAPHYTLLVGLATTATLEALLELVSADTRRNPYVRRRGGPR